MTYNELKKLVQKHCYLYYDKSAPEISDKEFDDLYDILEKVEKEQGWCDPDSPTVKVGGSGGKFKHPFQLYSLKKVYDSEEVDPAFDVSTPKIDGTNLTLIYMKGVLRVALTRGNGEVGDNVYHLAKEITNIPRTIEVSYDLFVVNGECVTDAEVDNFRNYVSGALGLKSAEEFKTRNIKFIAHDVLGVDLNYLTRLSIAKNIGFTVVTDDVVHNYPHDGIVYRLNDYKKSLQLGYTSKYPRFAVALKPRGKSTAITSLQDVIWEIGRTGTVNPVGIIDPVILEDATITRVTLHNISIIEENDLGLGDIIEVERAGGVIPKFIKVIEHAKLNTKITQKHAEIATGKSLRREGPKLVVLNKEDANSAKLVEYFVKTLDIKGLGPASIKKLKINHPIDIFSPDLDWSELGANGIKVLEEIEKTKNKPYETVLAALGIPGVGKSTAKLIVTYIPKFAHLADIRTTEIKGIGPSTIQSILDWLPSNVEWVEELPLNLEQKTQVTDLITVGAPAKKVCVTGKLDMSRSDMEDVLKSVGYIPVSSVTKDCYALITGGDNTSAKYKKAISYGIKVIDYWSSKKEVLSGNF